MTRDTCARCGSSFDESALVAIGSELVCPRCQLAATAVPAGSQPVVAPVVEDTPSEATTASRPEPSAKKPRARIAIASAPGTESVGFWRGMYRGVGEWCIGRCWWWRAPLMLLMAYWTIRHLTSPYFPEYRCLITPINLAIHEAGHLLFNPRAFGMFIQIAAGSVAQCLFPVLLIIPFLKQRDYFAIAICFGLLGVNLFEVAIYAADAQARNLTLVSPVTANPIHDWAYLLRALGIHLRHARTVAHCIRGLGTFSMLLCLMPGSWMVWRMFAARNQAHTADLPTPRERR